MDNVVDIVSTPKGQRYLIPDVTTCPPTPKKQAPKKQRSVNVLAKKFNEAAYEEDDDMSTAPPKNKGQST
ncbi:hypothetical protein TorRG33x02_300290 [Trema orientale]|uniref:Uncharacterized protein n=1 Tax=Trema orientale TaxID=63057 RepID=A0A2P5C2F9_TREOI|nr:hypothetical protein TorRG33x02_300290 [Trema orientale]